MNRTWTIAGVIAAVVVGVGVVLVSQKPKVTQPGLEEATQQEPSESVISAIAEATHSAQYLNSLSAEERKVAELDWTNPSVLKNSGAIITAVAKTADELEIGNCELRPLVLRTSPKPTFTIRNSGPKPYNIQAGDDIDVTVPAGSSIKVTSGLDAGTYGFNCGTKLKGLFLIAP